MLASLPFTLESILSKIKVKERVDDTILGLITKWQLSYWWVGSIYNMDMLDQGIARVLGWMKQEAERFHYTLQNGV